MAQKKDDIIVSGKGNDTPTAAQASNSYVFFKGAGKDTVVYDNTGKQSSCPKPFFHGDVASLA